MFQLKECRGQRREGAPCNNYLPNLGVVNATRMLERRAALAMDVVWYGTLRITVPSRRHGIVLGRIPCRLPTCKVF